MMAQDGGITKVVVIYTEGLKTININIMVAPREISEAQHSH